MENNSILEKVIDLAALAFNRTERKKIAKSSRFFEDLRADYDCRAMYEFILALEFAFDCKIPDAEVARMATVGDAVTCVERYRLC